MGSDNRRHASYHVYAMVNRTNGLPVLVFDEWLTNTDDPPMQRGRRLLIERMTKAWRFNPAGFPWVKEEADIPRFADEGYRLVDVELGLVIEERTVEELTGTLHGRRVFPSNLDLIRRRFGAPGGGQRPLREL